MTILPVIDLKQGQVVRGIAGCRDAYRPIESSLTSGSSPWAIAAALRREFGFERVYIADLDAIAGKTPQFAAYQAIAESFAELWIDAGIGTAQKGAVFTRECAEHRLKPRLIVGLESLESPEELAALAADHNLRFSLDLQHGKPITSIAAWQSAGPLEIAEYAVKSGVSAMIVLDLADVGMAGGTGTIDVVRQIKQRHPELQIIAGGGVRNMADLAELASAGCSAVLVASALHDGRLSPHDLQTYGQKS
jgi:phosphoribosylformimino-5-aminoimidazole carboxamide ribotide isomerase